jgi:hypothetical protein
MKAVLTFLLATLLAPTIITVSKASASVDSMRVAQDFSPRNYADSSVTQSDSSVSHPDSTVSLPKVHHGILNRIIAPLALTVLAGGLLLWLYLQRGH